jgi:acyl-CoA synthetase (AMP-forming)/AMP-acid ligase II
MVFDGYTDGRDKERVDGLLPTGDLGALVEDGLLMMFGRNDDMVVVGGENVYPSQLEDLLTTLPQVRECAVLGVPDAGMGQRLAAYVVLHPGAACTPEQIRSMAEARLARYAVPRDVVFLGGLPRNAVGKVVHRLLPGI